MLIPEEVRQCVVFLCCKRDEASEPVPGGTGFFLGVRKDAASPGHGYLVTAKHNIEGIQKSSVDNIVYLRANLKGAGAQIFETKMEDWCYHPTDSTVDVAVHPAGETPGMDFKVFPADGAAVTDPIASEGIGPGDEVFITGLFTNHFGKRRNIPITRIGNIAAMPEEPVDVKWCRPYPMEAYLIEARSIGGLSGSPVFVHIGPVSNKAGKVTVSHLRGGPFYLLGLIHGHWNMQPEPSLDTAEEDAEKFDKVNTGIAIVVPVSKILEVINQPKLLEMREKKDEAQRQENAADPD